MPAISMGCSSILYGLYRILNMGETPCPAAARHGPIELGWARGVETEGRAVSLLCLAKAASAHPPPDQVRLPI